MITELRPYQGQGVDSIHAAYEQAARAVCYTLPTGGGKTCIFTDIARRAAEAGTRTAILVHRDTLLIQASRKLYECGVQHSIIAPGRRGRYNDLVHVASVQTLVRRLEHHHFDFIVIDEAHHAVSPTYKKIFDRWPDAHLLGVTATPMRMDGRGLDQVFERLVLGPGISDLIADGYLVAPIAYGPAKRVDLSGVRTRMGDYDQRQLAEAMDTREITGDAVDHYRKLCPGVPAVAFCVSVKHAEDVAADFRAAGYRATSVDGTMDVAEIRRRVSGLSDGSVQVLTSCDLISEGFDAPAVSAAILLRPTKSLTVYLQQVGRALRPVYLPGVSLSTKSDRLRAIERSIKPNAIVLDHAGNCFKHGMADEPREWTLAGRQKRRSGAGGETVAVRQCPSCFCCHPPADVCPRCGHIYEAQERDLNVVDGELQQIDAAALRRARHDLIRGAKSYDDLKLVAKKLGYKTGWAWHVYNERRAR